MLHINLSNMDDETLISWKNAIELVLKKNIFMNWKM